MNTREQKDASLWEFTPDDIIEAIIDDIGSGSFAEYANTVRLDRPGPGFLTLDFGRRGRFNLTVEVELRAR